MRRIKRILPGDLWGWKEKRHRVELGLNTLFGEVQVTRGILPWANSTGLCPKWTGLGLCPEWTEVLLQTRPFIGKEKDASMFCHSSSSPPRMFPRCLGKGYAQALTTFPTTKTREFAMHRHASRVGWYLFPFKFQIFFVRTNFLMSEDTPQECSLSIIIEKLWMRFSFRICLSKKGRNSDLREFNLQNSRRATRGLTCSFLRGKLCRWRHGLHKRKPLWPFGE